MPVALPLIELTGLAVALLCIALAILIVEIMMKVGNVFRFVPVVGGYIADAVQTVAQAISNVLGTAEAGVDAAIGASWHALAAALNETWHLLVLASTGYKDLAELVARLVYAHSGLRSLVHFGEQALHSIRHAIRTLEHEWRDIEEKVKRLEHDVTRGIGHDLRIGLEKVEKEVSGVVNGTVPALERAIDGVSGELSQLGDFIKALPGTAYLDWVAGIVAVGLGALGLGALRCPSFLNSLKNRGCGMFNGLEDILGLFVDLFIVTDLCEVIPLLETAYEEVAAPAVHLLTEAIDAMPCVSGYQSPPMHLPALHLPSNPGFALSLP